jgi:hypothetical protein
MHLSIDSHKGGENFCFQTRIEYVSCQHRIRSDGRTIGGDTKASDKGGLDVKG